jgi:hypothetical protein
MERERCVSVSAKHLNLPSSCPGIGGDLPRPFDLGSRRSNTAQRPLLVLPTEDKATQGRSRAQGDLKMRLMPSSDRVRRQENRQ